MYYVLYPLFLNQGREDQLKKGGEKTGKLPARTKLGGGEKSGIWNLVTVISIQIPLTSRIEEAD